MTNEEKITRCLGKIAANTERIAKALEARNNPRQVIEGTMRRDIQTKEEYADQIKGWLDDIVAGMADKDPIDRAASEMVANNLKYSLDHIDERYDEYVRFEKQVPTLPSQFLVRDNKLLSRKEIKMDPITTYAERITDMVYAGASDEELNAVICQSMVAIKESARKNRLDEEMAKAILEG